MTRHVKVPASLLQTDKHLVMMMVPRLMNRVGTRGWYVSNGVISPRRGIAGVVHHWSRKNSLEKATRVVQGEVSASDTVDRRHVLLAACVIAASIVSLPCNSYAGDEKEFRMREVKMVLRVMALRGSVPQQWAADFKTALEGYGIPAISYKPTVSDIWKEMSGRTPTTVDAVAVGDAWLERAVVEGRIQPIENPEQYRYWNALNNILKRLIRRDIDGRVSASGRVYAVPYRWGCTVIVYRKDRVARWGNTRISDWDDLLSSKLKHKIAFMDSPRELIGIALKTLGLSYNADVAALQACGVSQENLGMRVRRLISQAKVISNKDHIRAYSAGDVDVIVGSSDDLIPLAQKSSNSAVVVPASGTALWADVWCVPRHAAGGYVITIVVWLIYIDTV